ncbi:MAG TPA: transcription antitermination factor NusB [Pirellulaceae bacterium]|nr:transcription antitermination factor NusB [Pirellulaceae bacterium]
MSRRSKAREVVLQLLYQDDLNSDRRLTADEAFVRERLEEDLSLVDFAWDLLRGVRSRRREIDEALARVAANWSLERMAATDRNALRIGAYEILFATTPDRVAVNEAVELAKRFGAAQSAPFVNGVLDRLMHDRRPARGPATPAVTAEASDQDETESD